MTNRLEGYIICLNGEAKINKLKLYQPMCTVCQYMKLHRAFAEAIILSSYFDPNGTENLRDVLQRYNDPFKYQTLYKHCQRHMRENIDRWRSSAKLVEKSAAMTKKERAKEIVEQTMAVVDAPTRTISPHEMVLDKFIAKGEEKIDINSLPITAQTLIQAIKAKAEIENKTKDRRYDALKQLFTGAAPKQDKDDTANS